jgi:hypothetical protein
MYLNLIGIGLLSLFIGVLVYYSRAPVVLINPMRSGLLVAQDTGKTKQIVSKTGDASMVTEKTRRIAIGSNRTQSIKETTYQKGSVTGALEMMLTSICPAYIMYSTYYDAGTATNDFCNILDDAGDGLAYDAGNAASNVVCCPDVIPEMQYSAGTASNDFCGILDDTGDGVAYDAGNAPTTVCSS